MHVLRSSSRYGEDEPTSGLDAASAAEIMAQLRRLASDTGVIIVASVHQPSTHVFNSFDQVRQFKRTEKLALSGVLDVVHHEAAAHRKHSAE